MSDGGTWQAPQPGATPPLPPDRGGTFAPPGSVPDDVAIEPAAQPSGRSRGKVIAAAVGAVAIVAGGVFAATRLAGDADAGGASSPEEVGLGFLAALENEDVLAMADLLLPGERDTLRDPAVDMVTELQRLEVLSEDATLDAIGGVDLVLEDESVEVTDTNVDDIVNLAVTATGAGSIDGEALPIGDWIREEMDDDPAELDVDASDPEVADLEMTAVREDGRWYLSLFHSIAETVRNDQPEVSDIPTEGVAPTGGDSPEAAMDAMLDAFEQLDLAAMIAALNPDEFQALQRYAPIFLDDAQSELDAVDVRVDVDDREYAVSGSGGSRSIVIEAMSLEIAAEGETLTGELRDGCFTATVDDETIDTCETAGEIPDLGDILEDPQPVEDLLATLQDTFADYENPGLLVEEVDGQWFVSPMATVADQLLAVVRALTREEIEDLTSQVTDVVDVFDDLVLGVSPDLPVADDFELPGDDEQAAPDDTVPSDETVPGESADDCFLEDDPTAAASCFQALVDDGSIEVESFPFYLRFPECGLAEPAWSGDYYSLPDTEFVALVEEAAPCFQALIASGELTEFAVPGEITSPECLEGRNWYLVEDEAYIDAFETCAYG